MIAPHSVLVLVITAPLLVSALHHAPIHRKSLHLSHREPRQILSPRASASAALTSYNDLLYTVPITLAETDQVFNLDLDTGSSDTWIRGPNCKAADKGSECKGDSVDIVKGVKNGLKDMGTQFGQVYGSGQVYAEIYEGTLSATGASSENIYFGVSVSESGFTNGTISDGILGLGFEYISNIGVLVDSGNGASANFFDQLGNTGSENRFGIYLSTVAGTAGEITFGGVNSKRYTGKPACLPLSDSARGYWSFSINKATWAVQTPESDGASVLGSGKLDTASDDAIVDTGSSLIYLDQDAADGINEQIGNTQYDSKYQLYVIDCSVKQTGPDVVFTIGKVTLVIPASVYVVPFGSSTCVSGFTVGANGGVLRFDTIYDKNGSQTCFALANHGSAATSTTATPTSTTTTEVTTTEVVTTITEAPSTTTKTTKTTTTSTTTTETSTTESSSLSASTSTSTKITSTTTSAPSFTTPPYTSTASTKTASVQAATLTNTDKPPTSTGFETDTVTKHVTATDFITKHVTETDRITDFETITDTIVVTDYDGTGTETITETIVETVTEVDTVMPTDTGRPVYTHPPTPCPEEQATYAVAKSGKSIHTSGTLISPIFPCGCSMFDTSNGDLSANGGGSGSVNAESVLAFVGTRVSGASDPDHASRRQVEGLNTFLSVVATLMCSKRGRRQRTAVEWWMTEPLAIRGLTIIVGADA
ncbi:hypothetical protein HK101_001721 [Irineochytrium annulatum]|nr:hypothetical protein HK101_001721 [Irineochytrium annulatum]